MLDFLKKIFSVRDREITFVLFDDEEPAASNSYTFEPRQLWQLFYACLAGVVVLILLIVMFTPVGTLVYNKEDEQLRESVIEISQKVQALKDSLDVRDMQLYEIQEVLASGEDTSFNVTGSIGSGSRSVENTDRREQTFPTQVSMEKVISKNEIIFSSLFKKAPEFPAFYPVEGTLTRGYNPENGHFGIDIATRADKPFKAIADGAIVSQDWTINYGYVIQVQHNDGIISVYKHASSVSKGVGDVILKGEILGTAGDVGILSTGPHLHLEIWKKGVPQNPNTYLIK